MKTHPRPLAIIILFLLVFNQLPLVQAMPRNSQWTLGAGLGPNFSKMDAHNDDLKSDFGWQIWLRRYFNEKWHLNLTFDDLNFDGSANMQNYMLGLGHDLYTSEKWNFYAILGAGLGHAKEFPRATADQKRLALELRPGIDYIGWKRWSLGLAVEFIYVDLDDNFAKEAYSALPMLTASYRFGSSNDESEKTTPQKTQSVAQEITEDTDEDGVIDIYDQCPDSPRSSLVNNFGCVKNQKIEMELKINFASGSHEIPSSAYDQLNRMAELLRRNPSSTVLIEGHTDSTGSFEKNYILSLNRAGSVRKFLIERENIEMKRISARGFGPKIPVASNNTAQGRFKNRRVIGVFKSNED